jgi:hypothetical protein
VVNLHQCLITQHFFLTKTLDGFLERWRGPIERMRSGNWSWWDWILISMFRQLIYLISLNRSNVECVKRLISLFKSSMKDRRTFVHGTFDRWYFWPLERLYFWVIWPKIIWPKWSFDRIVIWPKWSFDRNVIWPKWSFDRNVIWPKCHFTEKKSFSTESRIM